VPERTAVILGLSAADTEIPPALPSEEPTPWRARKTCMNIRHLLQERSSIGSDSAKHYARVSWSAACWSVRESFAKSGSYTIAVTWSPSAI